MDNFGNLPLYKQAIILLIPLSVLVLALFVRRKTRGQGLTLDSINSEAGAQQYVQNVQHKSYTPWASVLFLLLGALGVLVSWNRFDVVFWPLTAVFLFIGVYNLIDNFMPGAKDTPFKQKPKGVQAIETALLWGTGGGVVALIVGEVLQASQGIVPRTTGMLILITLLIALPGLRGTYYLYKISKKQN